MSHKVIKIDNDTEVNYNEDVFEVVSPTNKEFPALTNKDLQNVLKQFPDDAIMLIHNDNGYSVLKYGELGATMGDMMFPGSFKDTLFASSENQKVLALWSTNTEPPMFLHHLYNKEEGQE